MDQFAATRDGYMHSFRVVPNNIILGLFVQKGLLFLFIHSLLQIIYSLTIVFYAMPY